MALRSPPPGYIDVGRSTIYGNPFHIGGIAPDGTRMTDAGSTIPYYRAYIEEKIQDDLLFADAVCRLKGLKLWCPGCGINSPTCHARVLEELANR